MRTSLLLVAPLCMGCSGGSGSGEPDETRREDPPARADTTGPEDAGGATDIVDAARPGSPSPDDEVPEPELSEGPGDYVPDFESSDEFFSLTDGLVPALETSPHGVVQIFYSQNLRPLFELSSFVAPTGSVAIKVQDNNADGNVDAIMVMIKLSPGSDSVTADWRYERRRADGALDASGSPSLDFCATCHMRWPDTDRLAGITLRD